MYNMKLNNENKQHAKTLIKWAQNQNNTSGVNINDAKKKNFKTLPIVFNVCFFK